MAEVLFYHLTRDPLERTLPDLLERSVARGWRAIVRAGSEAQVNTLDRLLWTYRDDSFLAHGTPAMGQDAAQPILLTTQAGNPNGAAVLMLVEGARIDCDEARAFDRTCLIFNGNEAQALEDARADWRKVTEAGLPAKYWAQDDGRWVEKASR